VRVEATRRIDAPVERVWELLTAWEAQARWMGDVREVRVTTPEREGTGVRIEADTYIVPKVVVSDPIVVTEWSPPHTLVAQHVGRLIRGIGVFELTPSEGGTILSWWEELSVPFGSVGETVAGFVIEPPTRRRFQRSLAAFAEMCEAGPSR